MGETKDMVLDIKDLSVSFRMYRGGLRQEELTVISDLNVFVKAGEVVAVIGSSGSGKSLLAHAILGILPNNSTVTGSIEYMGEKLNSKRQNQLRGREIALVPQSVNYLDPMMRVGKQVIGSYGTKEQQEAAFKRFALASSTADKYPFQLSGGMARRVLISTVITSGAHLVIADEPTPGLGVREAKEVLNSFREIADEGNAVLLITHDIDLAVTIADRIAVFYAGTTVEIANRENFQGNGEMLRHPYTKAMWRSLPQNTFESLPGLQPYAGTAISGCPFIDRCPIRGWECEGKIEMRSLRGGLVRCCHAT